MITEEQLATAYAALKVVDEVAKERDLMVLQNCFANHEYFTTRGSYFYTAVDGDGTMRGEKVFVSYASECEPIRLSGSSLLVRHTLNGRHCYAWIHA